ncbi:hypothetical protein [Noviherbaspirillum aridicola]|uniref:Uncharacterized protein n=1 Tax=Noviherbaspirillum aridicola TaxID=2849687 RepID=A0ABQ4Q8R1_9BURK|nr:hypothetical protein [Noviherbaspirillum aridicola]GIZ53376.1 hypothetical protein NCCP691_33900 [Noviherbaspirillum aridicola]
MNSSKQITIDGQAYELSDEFLSRVLQVAAEGGCSYWADASVESEGDAAGPDGARDFDVSDYVEDDAEVHGDEREDIEYQAVSFLAQDDPAQGGTLDLQGVADAIERIANEEAEVAPAIRAIILAAVEEGDPTDIDAEAADCIVQVGLFDEIVYG